MALLFSIPVGTALSVKVFIARPVLESKDMCAIFQKKGEKKASRAKYLKILGKIDKIC